MDSSATSIAYGRALIELGILPPDRVRSMGQHCLQQGLDLRGELLRRGLIDPAADARAVALLQSRTAADPGSRPASASGTGTRDSKGILVEKAAALPEPGQVVGGCQIERELARGGMGAVFIAHTPDGTQVALKVVLGDLDTSNRRERFEREAEIGENLRHPGIVKVLGHGEEAGLAYMVMEFLEGSRPMDDYVHAQQTPLRERVRLMLEVCEALAAAHAVGIFHRDLKPDNVLVMPGGEIKVVDFGLAKQIDRDRLTQSGAMMGTLHYMAPEQVSGQTAHADARCDVFALGVMLYELVAGERPFNGETGVEIMRKIIEADPPALGKRVGDLGALEDVVGMALAKAPDDRYSEAGAMGRDLAAVLSGSTVSGAARSLRRRGTSRRRAPKLAAALAVVGLVAWLVLRGPAPLDAAALTAQARALDKEAIATLRVSKRSLVEDASHVEALGDRLAALEREYERSRAGGVAVPAERVARARQRVRAALGLLALARGADEPGLTLGQGADAEDPTALAFNGAVAAVTTEADAAAAARALSSALARGLGRPELVRWRAAALARAGFTSRTDAEEVLSDLDRIAADREPTPQELAIRIRALVALERADEAAALLERLEQPGPALRWQVALARVALYVEPRTADALAALEGLPPFVGDERRRAELATEAYRIAGDVVGALASGEPTPPRLGRLIQVGRALAPDRPLEPSFRDAVFGHVTRVGRSSDLPLAVTLVELFPDDRVVQRRCGSLAEEPGCSPAQRKVFLRAIRRTVELTDDPAERQEVEIGLCQLLSRLGKNEEVITLATRLLERLQAPIARAAVLLIRGRAFRYTHKLENALADLDESIAVHEVTIHVRPDRAFVLREMGRGEEALADAMRYFDAADEHVASQGAMATVVWDVTRENGRNDLARSALEKYCTWQPSQPHAWHTRLAYLRLLDGEVPGAAEALEAGAAKLKAKGHPGAAAAARILALLQAGDGEAARAPLEALVESLEDTK